MPRNLIKSLLCPLICLLFCLSAEVVNGSCQQAINKLGDSAPGAEVVALQLLPLNPKNSTPSESQQKNDHIIDRQNLTKKIVYSPGNTFSVSAKEKN